MLVLCARTDPTAPPLPDDVSGVDDCVMIADCIMAAGVKLMLNLLPALALHVMDAVGRRLARVLCMADWKA